MYTDQLNAEILAQGSLEPLGQFTYGSNFTFLVTASLQGKSVRAVYKPQKGERPLWDFPDGTLANRETAAYRLSAALGWDLVPLTILRKDAPFGPGSLQLFIEHNPARHYFNLPAELLDLLQPLALFDLIANNADRKGSHFLFRIPDDHLYAIDHGLCFNAEQKLRTVIWNFAGKPIPQNLRELIGELGDSGHPLYKFGEFGLADLLAPEEIEALRTRISVIVADPVFPFPPEDKQAYPYPPL